MEELIDCLETRYSPSEIIQILNEFDEQKLEDYALENDLCVRCGGELIIHRWNEKHEFWGAIVEEPLSELTCRCCGETY